MLDKYPILNSKTLWMSIILAQTTHSPVVMSEDEGFVIEEVVVTARKREESVMDVPVSVSAYSSKELEYRQIRTTDELTAVTPNLQFGSNAPSSGHNSAATVFIRGVGQPDFIPSSDPGVGLYVDGVYIARSIGSATELLDLERIEVLRGPQGTLFGRNTIGGAIVLHTKRPSDEFGGEVELLVGDDNRFEAEGNLSIPLSDTLRMKLGFANRQRDGYVTNEYTGEDLGDDNSTGFRVAVDWDISESVNAYWTADIITEDESGSPTVFNSLNTSGLFARLAAGTAGPPPTVPDFGDRGVPDSNEVHQLCGFQNSAGDDIDDTGFHSDVVLNCGTAGVFDLGNLGPHKNYANGDLESTLDVFGSSLTLTADFGPVSLKSITAYRSTEYDVKRDADNTPLTILHSENHDEITQFSQEFQLTGIAFSDRARWVLGAYYFEEESDFDNPVLLPALTVGALNNAGDLETKNKAIFGQITFDLTDRIHATLGVRRTEEEKRATPNFFAIGNYNVPNPFSTVGQRCGGPGLVTISDSASAIDRPDAHCITLGDGDLLYAKRENSLDVSQTTPMASVSFDVHDTGMLYMTYSEGFKSGGFSTRIIQPVPSENNPDGVSFLPTFDPEEAQTYEIGYKAQFDTFRFTVAVFTTEYQNQHVVVRQGVAPITFNAGESTISGFEVEGTWAPTNKWFVTGGIGYTDGEYDSFSGLLADLYDQALADSNSGTGPAPENIDGLVDLEDKLAYTPDLTANIGISYLMATDIGNFTSRLDWFYKDGIYFDAPNSEAIAEGSVDLLNALVSWEDVNKNWEVILALKNITDETYRSGGNISFSGSAYAESTYSRSRELSLSAKYRF